MKVIKYNVKVKIEVKDAKKEEEHLKNSLVKAFSYKKDGNLVSPKLSVSENSVEIEGLKFRKLVNVREFISNLAEDYHVQCGKLNKAENLMTVECNGQNAKLYFEVKTERRVKPKKEAKKEEKKEEAKAEKKEEKKEEKSEAGKNEG